MDTIRLINEDARCMRSYNTVDKNLHEIVVVLLTICIYNIEGEIWVGRDNVI